MQVKTTDHCCVLVHSKVYTPFLFQWTESAVPMVPMTPVILLMNAFTCSDSSWIFLPIPVNLPIRFQCDSVRVIRITEFGSRGSGCLNGVYTVRIITVCQERFMNRNLKIPIGILLSTAIYAFAKIALSQTPAHCAHLVGLFSPSSLFPFEVYRVRLWFPCLPLARSTCTTYLQVYLTEWLLLSARGHLEPGSHRVWLNV